MYQNVERELYQSRRKQQEKEFIRLKYDAEYKYYKTINSKRMLKLIETYNLN